MTPDTALQELRRCEGTQFDPLIVDAAVAALSRMAPNESGAGADVVLDRRRPFTSRPSPGSVQSAR
jgi:HD-GYP domain-containing protein (c-di-GMP phosphodiesterase class II)